MIYLQHLCIFRSEIPWNILISKDSTTKLIINNPFFDYLRKIYAFYAFLMFLHVGSYFSHTIFCKTPNYEANIKQNYI